MFSELSKVIEFKCFISYMYITRVHLNLEYHVLTYLEPTTWNMYICFQLLCLLHIWQFWEKLPLENDPISFIFLLFPTLPWMMSNFALSFSYALLLFQLCYPSMTQEISILSIKQPWLTKSIIASPFQASIKN